MRDWQQFLARVGFDFPLKFEWSLMANTERDCYQVQLSLHTRDVRDGTYTTVFQLHDFPEYSLFMDDESRLRWLRGKIVFLLKHEVDEWLRLDGQRILNPHKTDSM